MYIVLNLTNRTLVIADLKIQIEPRKIQDLERIVPRETLERSRDLKQAISNQQLRLVKYSVVKSKHVAAPPSEKNEIDEDKLRDMIRNTISEEMSKKNTSHLESILNDGVKSLQNQIRDQLSNIKYSPSESVVVESKPLINDAQLAEMHQKSLEKMSDSIETGGSDHSKKIKIINNNVKNIADEL